MTQTNNHNSTSSKQSPDTHKPRKSNNSLAAGIAIAVGVGLAIGSAVNNIGAGVAIGVALGIGLASGSRKEKKPPNE